MLGRVRQLFRANPFFKQRQPLGGVSGMIEETPLSLKGCTQKGVYPENLRTFCAVLLKLAFFLTFSMFGLDNSEEAKQQLLKLS